MRNLIKASIATAAFAALFVVPSVASAIQLTAPTGTTYSGNIIGTNVAHAGTAKHTLFTTNLGTVTCDVATLTGTTVGADGNHVAGEITTAQFEGPEKGKPCTSPVGTVSPTPNHITNPEHNGRKSLPWCITAGKENKIEVWSKNAGEVCNVQGGGGAIIGPTFTLHSSVAGTCAYAKEKPGALVGTYTTHPADGIATVTKDQIYKKVTGGGFCPSEGKLDMAFTMTVDNVGDTEGGAIWIDP